MSLFSKLAGIIGTTLQLDVVNGGPRSKNEAGAMAFRNAADNAYAIVRGLDPVGAQDFATKNYVDLLSRNVSYYVNTATGNDANPGTQASPFATFAKAWSVVLPWQIANIYLAAAQTFVLPSTTSSLTIPTGATITIVGVYASQVGARTALAAGSTTTLIQDAAGGLVVNASRGDWLQWDPNTTTVALRGTGGTIRSNTAGAFTLFDAQAAVPSNTDTFTVRRTTSILQWTARAQIDVTSGNLYSDVVQWQSNTATAATAVCKIVGNGTFRARGSRFIQAGAGQGQFFFSEARASIGTFASPSNGPSNRWQAAGRAIPDGLWEHGCFVSSASALVSSTPGSLLYCQNLVYNGTAGGGSVSAFSGARLVVFGIDGLNIVLGCDGAGSSCLLRQTISGGGINTIAGANAGQAGTLFCDDSAFAEFNSTDVSTTSLPGIAVQRNSTAQAGLFSAITGAANSVGVQVDGDSRLTYYSGGLTVTGAAGDTSVDGVIRPYAAYANTSKASLFSIVSTWSEPGSLITWSGTFLAAAAALTTVYYGQGGSPVVNLSSATALRFPMPNGSNLRNLRGTILANPLATTTTFTIYKAPVATGVPASTALVVSVTAGTTGSVSDISHVVTFQDGDQIDLRSDNTNGGVATMVSTWAAQAA